MVTRVNQVEGTKIQTLKFLVIDDILFLSPRFLRKYELDIFTYTHTHTHTRRKTNYKPPKTKPNEKKFAQPTTTTTATTNERMNIREIRSIDFSLSFG
jgi:hypothetical protein